MKTKTRKAFTLLEMVVVLSLLALVTHLAVREVSHLKSSEVRRKADAQLEDIRVAVVGSSDERDISGQRVRTGFLSDLGRLPRLVMTNGVLSLSELWVRPAAVGAFAVRPATAANLVKATSADQDNEVFVPCGWRGPYIASVSSVDGRLRDAWGNLIESPDETGSRLRFVSDTANISHVAEGDDVIAVRHFGADGICDVLRHPETEHDTDFVVRFDDATNATLTVYLNFYNSDGVQQAAQLSTVRVYSPAGDKISVARQTGVGTVTVTGLTPGMRVMRVESGGQKLGSARLIALQSGANFVTERFYVASGASDAAEGGNR